METKSMITINAQVNATLETVWNSWTEPKHITQWNQASPDWHCPSATNDLRAGGNYSFTMAAKDGSFSFDFGGTYTEVIPMKKITSELGDGRRIETIFEEKDGGVYITESFDPESQNPEEFQKAGWQAILDSFVKYTEGLK